MRISSWLLILSILQTFSCSTVNNTEGKDVKFNDQWTGYFNTIPVTKKPEKILWQVRSNGIIESQPLVKGDTLYFTSLDSHLYAIDSSGEVIWKYDLGGWSSSEYIIANNEYIFISSFKPQRVISPIDSYYVSAIRRIDGKLEWSFRTSGIPTGISLYNERIFFADNEGYIYSLDVSTGKGLKTNSQLFPISASLHYTKGSLFITSYDPFICSINSVDGTTVWYKPLQNFVDVPIVSDSMSIYIKDVSGYLFALDITSGDLLWKIHIPNSTRSYISIIEDALIVSSDSEYVSMIKTTGDIVWKTKLNSNERLATPIIVKDYLYINSPTTIYCLNRKNGKVLWKTELPLSKYLTPPYIHRGKLYTVLNDSSIAVLKD